MKRWAALAVLIIVIVLLLLYPLALAMAHDSWISRERITDPVTGEWCCNHQDCREEPGNVEAVDGGYRIKSTGEVIPRQRVIWRSPGGWWRCRYLDPAKNGATRCLIGPPQGM